MTGIPARDSPVPERISREQWVLTLPRPAGRPDGSANRSARHGRYGGAHSRTWPQRSAITSPR